MKTKLSILTALVALASAATVQAQTVYSLNIVGYVNTRIPAGFSMIGNPLNGTSQTLSSLMATPPNNTSVYKFNPATGGYIVDSYVDNAWEGDTAGAMTIAPGEGVFVSTQTTFTNTFVGEVVLNSTNVIPSGFSIKSSVLPRSAALYNPAAPTQDLDLPVGNNDSVYQYNPVSGGYIVNSYVDNAWEGDNGGLAPTPAVGEAFYYYRASAGNTNWVQTFSVGP